MQIRAICEAAAELVKEKVDAHAQIMIPQVGSVTELIQIKKIYDICKMLMKQILTGDLQVQYHNYGL